MHLNLLYVFLVLVDFHTKCNFHRNGNTFADRHTIMNRGKRTKTRRTNVESTKRMHFIIINDLMTNSCEMIWTFADGGERAVGYILVRTQYD